MIVSHLKSIQKTLPLWKCISLALIIAMMVVAYVATHVGLEKRKTELESTLKNQSLRTLQVLSAAARVPVITEDIEYLDTLAKDSLRFDPDLYAITIFDDSGQELFSWLHENVRKEPESYTYEEDIEYEGEKFGRIVASWNPTRLSLIHI